MNIIKKLLTLILVYVSITSFAYTQNSTQIKWEKTYGGSDGDFMQSMTSTVDGGYLLGGLTQSEDGDIQSGNQGGSSDSWVVKIASEGNLEWERTYGGSGDDMFYLVLATGNGFILGGHSTSNDGDVQSGNKGGADFWVVKIDSEGIIEWEKTYGGSNYEVLKTGLLTSDGGCLLGGYTQSNDGDIQSEYQGQMDFWVIKIDSVGNLEWEQTYGGSRDDELLSIITVPDGGYLLGGYSKSNGGDVQSGNHGSMDFWVVKIDSVGNLEWENTFGGINDDSIRSILSTPDDGYLLGGYTFSKDGDVYSGNQGYSDFWVVKIDAEGNLEWEQTFGGSHYDLLGSLASISDGGFLLGGHTQSNDGDIQSGNHGQADFWLVKIDSEGNLEWEQTFGGSSSDVLWQILAKSNGDCFLGGYSGSNNGDVHSGNQRGTDFWVVKTGINNSPTNISLSASTVDENMPNGSLVGTLSSTDEDIRDTHTYSLVTGDGDTENNSFTITNDQLITDKIFDFETKSSFSIRVLTDDGNSGTFSKSFTIFINNTNDMVITDITYGLPYCTNDEIGSIEIEVDEFIPPLSFLWSSGQTTQNIYNISSGIYTITITDGAGMIFNEAFYLEPKPIYNGTSICYLTSENLSNVIHIDKGLENYNVEKYVMYREGKNIGEFDKIGDINYTEDFFIDSLVNNKSRSYSYKVSMIDKCGNESTKSSYHSTIHLSINSSTNNGVNLFWSHYVGLDIPSYSIFRKKENEEYVLLQEISSNNFTYTDFPSESNSLYSYYVSLEVKSSCFTSINQKSEGVIEIKSNTVSLNESSINDEFYNKDVDVFPNPANNILYISGELIINLINIYNPLGRHIKTVDYTEDGIDISDLTKGLYYIEIKLLNNSSLLKTMIKN